jgi:hypothetical protein
MNNILLPFIATYGQEVRYLEYGIGVFIDRLGPDPKAEFTSKPLVR